MPNPRPQTALLQTPGKTTGKGRKSGKRGKEGRGRMEVE